MVATEVVPTAVSTVVDELPGTLTVGDLTDAINRSQTIRGVAQDIGLDRALTKRLLVAFSLVEFVSYRLAADRITISSDEVLRRVETAGR